MSRHHTVHIHIWLRPLQYACVQAHHGMPSAIINCWASHAARLWPVQANGFGDLSRRARVQQDALEENRSRLDALRDLSYKLAKRQQGELRARTAAMQARHVELSGRLLKVARHVDGLEGRLAMFMGVRWVLAWAG